MEVLFVPEIACMRLTNGAMEWVWSALRASSVKNQQIVIVVFHTFRMICNSY